MYWWRAVRCSTRPVPSRHCPLSPELEAFLTTASRRSTSDWVDLKLIDDAQDCISNGEVNQQALFRRTATVVHHGESRDDRESSRAGAYGRCEGRGRTADGVVIRLMRAVAA
jgi:hypothetical protein